MAIITHIKTFFASFTIKLFIWFWLIAIISIACTRFISQQLSYDAFNKTVVKTASPSELKQLSRIEHHIKRYNITSIKHLRQLKFKHSDQKPINIWIKPLNSNDMVQNLFPIAYKPQQAIQRYISSNTFTQPKAHLFTHTRLIGPRIIDINQKQYQLFISNKYHKQNFGRLVQRLPTWARIAIPTLISFILCLLLAKSFSRPIRVMQDAANDIGKGDFSTRVNKISKRSDELGQLANSFNQMAEQLQQQQSAQKRLLGDVSHELRSPLTRLQMALGLAQQQATSEQAREQYLQRCQLEIERLEKMVADVLSLSRLENTLQTMETEKVHLNTLVSNIVSDEQFIADEKGINISVNAEQDIYTHADRTLLTSAISNVLSNAVKYSPENSQIILALTKNQQTLYLTVTDSGHGVPEEALSKLFSPFYRVNLARDRKTGGTGLGLAIAKQAIIAHQGKISAKNNSAAKGLSVTIELPCL